MGLDDLYFLYWRNRCWFSGANRYVFGQCNDCDIHFAASFGVDYDDED